MTTEAVVSSSLYLTNVSATQLTQLLGIAPLAPSLWDSMDLVRTEASGKSVWNPKVMQWVSSACIPQET